VRRAVAKSERKSKKRITQRREGHRGFAEKRGDARRGWESMFTVDVTATRDNLSSYLLCSNDSNDVGIGCKLIRRLRMRGNLARESGVCVTPG
jgi:hypothetical protein